MWGLTKQQEAAVPSHTPKSHNVERQTIVLVFMLWGDATWRNCKEFKATQNSIKYLVIFVSPGSGWGPRSLQHNKAGCTPNTFNLTAFGVQE